jgi:hypothetical protein
MGTAVIVSVLAACFGGSSAAGEAAPVVTGAGRCVVIIGANETACKRAGLVRADGIARLDVESAKGRMVLSGSLDPAPTADAPALSVATIDYGPARHAPAHGQCTLALSADGRAITDIDCDTFSAFGEIRVQFLVVEPPK